MKYNDTSLIIVATIITLILGVALLIIIKYFRQIKNNKSELLNKEEEIQKIEKERDAGLEKLKYFESQIQALSKYEGILNADKAIEENKKQFEVEKSKALAKIKDQVQQINEKIHTAEQNIKARQAQLQTYIKSTEEQIAAKDREAEQKRSKLLRETDQLIVDKKSKLEEELQNAKRSITEQLKEANIKREEIFKTSQHESAKIIERAENRAEEIAGDALKVAGKKVQLEAAIKAMQNTIYGYRDEYLVPAFSLLDELAEVYGFKEAGYELKKRREQVKLMIKNQLAATCDYVEPNRRSYAIHFTLDAFNGKVDSILSKVRHNNYGTLQQQIKDAFNIVNHNGAAFRDAKITQEYLDIRLDELKWAVAVYELQLQDREEQKRIKQEMRDEEIAKREYEKAIKEAEKEEKMLKKAMEKAREELQSASETQKEEFEIKLRELEEKLVAAEEKNQRAISMAQQTRRGHVYVISNKGSFGEDVLKIGLTRRLEPMDRVRELGDASVPFPFDVHAMMYSEDAPNLEKELHQTFREHQVNKVNPRKEFFNINLANVKETTTKLGIEALWTMAAEAREYRESLAMVKYLRDQATPEAFAAENQYMNVK